MYITPPADMAVQPAASIELAGGARVTAECVEHVALCFGSDEVLLCSLEGAASRLQRAGAQHPAASWAAEAPARAPEQD